jgi:hypothetical protein
MSTPVAPNARRGVRMIAMALSAILRGPCGEVIHP